MPDTAGTAATTDRMTHITGSGLPSATSASYRSRTPYNYVEYNRLNRERQQEYWQWRRANEARFRNDPRFRENQRYAPNGRYANDHDRDDRRRNDHDADDRGRTYARTRNGDRDRHQADRNRHKVKDRDRDHDRR